jgi:shikimate kinase
MASGKSAVARAIANLSGLKYIDLDDFISQKEGMRIPDIFKQKGEIYFRKKERLYLDEILSQKATIIVAVGGGTPCYGKNMALINQKATSIFINTPLNILVNRLISEKTTRPLVADLNDADLPEFVAKHLFERMPFYEKAQYTIAATDKSLDEIASEILKLIR